MSQIDPCAPHLFLIARRPPSAVSQDEDIYLTLAVAAPTLPDEVETIDIYLTVDFAQADDPAAFGGGRRRGERRRLLSRRTALRSARVDRNQRRRLAGERRQRHRAGQSLE